ncbi:ribosome maturation factor RimM [Sinimarinibacterium sp. NLF-5-8]|uniref:ribosome maturation factor RimM n=1 Tax=Sinimarinibacterium sp. NLF-5-8 TaxID=2698684 RepID=UPI00137BA552|nr:ribosome maturation factor RimM [Sinimarinibacterium sp. NLF-5-8]QHS11173.1 16S rRNA processing protein RimM [Sinimarinibacterium sp. NLF-5-8]
MNTPRVTLGRVIGVYGVRGWLRIDAQTQTPVQILKYPVWTIRHGEQCFEAQIVDGRGHGGGVVAQITGADGQPIADRDVAAQWIGALIEVDRSALPPLPEGRYYWVDLVGLSVSNPAGVELGVVHDVTTNGAQEVLVLKDAAGIERLIPFVKPQIVVDVDLAQRRIVCNWEADY